MKISLSWLSDYVDVGTDVDAIARKLTMGGLEIEGIHRPGAALNGVVVAQILESVQHPNADKLSVTKVSMGGPAPLQVVCGAKNYKVGDKVPLATVGTVLPNGTAIKQAALRGVDSFGMLCSSRELGLNEEHAGLLTLDPSLEVGTPIAKALGIDDVVLEVNVTPNRADALSHLGVAREVATLFGKALKFPQAPLQESSELASTRISVRIDDADRCWRYAARVIEGVKIGPSPRWMQDRLKAVGVRALNNVVDVTNYVLFEYGQPLHAFDLDCIADKQIIVRTAKPGEKMVTLDGKTRELSTEDLLICDAKQGQALGGVMGGSTSEVSEKTTRVLLEGAAFHPTSIRRTAKRHALHSESSHRFERGIDIPRIPEVLDRAASLIVQVAGGTVLKGLIDVCPGKQQADTVELRTAKVASVLGVEVPAKECHTILTSLGFKKLSGDESRATFEIPAHRHDVTVEEDLIEEIVRIRGFDTIPTALPPGLSSLQPESKHSQVERRIRTALAGAGHHEVVNYSFVSPKELEAFSALAGAVTISNPLTVEQSVMRTTMFASLVQNVIRAKRHQAHGVRLYEIGRVYQTDADGGVDRRPVALERGQVAGVVWGLRDGSRSWTSKDAENDFFDAKASIESVLRALNIEGAEYASFDSPWYHPRASARITARGGKLELGTFGQLHPVVARSLDAPEGVFVFQLNLDALIEGAVLVPQAEGLTKFPSVLRDLAVVVPSTMQSRDVEKVILSVGAPLVDEARVFDVYEGPQVGEGKKNVAFALRYRAPDRTLTDIEVNEAHQRIIAEVSSRLGGALRAS